MAHPGMPGALFWHTVGRQEHCFGTPWDARSTVLAHCGMPGALFWHTVGCQEHCFCNVRKWDAGHTITALPKTRRGHVRSTALVLARMRNGGCECAKKTGNCRITHDYAIRGHSRSNVFQCSKRPHAYHHFPMCEKDHTLRKPFRNARERPRGRIAVYWRWKKGTQTGHTVY